MKIFIRFIFGKVLDLLLLIYLNVVGDILNFFGLNDYFVVIFEVNLKFIRFVKYLYKVYLYNKVNFDGL